MSDLPFARQKKCLKFPSYPVVIAASATGFNAAAKKLSQV
jgi:hypothetical protein